MKALRVTVTFLPGSQLKEGVSAVAGAPGGGTAAGETAICEATASRKARQVVTPLRNLSLLVGCWSRSAQFSCPFLARSCATSV